MTPETQFLTLTLEQMRDRLKAIVASTDSISTASHTLVERSQEMNVHTKYPIDTTNILFMIDGTQSGLMWGRKQYDWLYYTFEVLAVSGSAATTLRFDLIVPADADICAPWETGGDTTKFLEFQGLAAEINAPRKVPGLFSYTFDSVRFVAPKNTPKAQEEPKCSGCHS